MEPGMTVSLGRTSNVDRQSNEFRFSNQRAFGTWTALSRPGSACSALGNACLCTRICERKTMGLPQGWTLYQGRDTE